MTIALSDIWSLTRHVEGPVMSPGDPGYEEELATFNLAARHRPEVVVAALHAGDVAAAVRWAADHRMPVAVQATGHGAVVSYGRGMVISTRHLQELTLDPAARQVRAGAGVRWRRVIDAAAPYGLAPLNGSSSDVGAVGYTLGGGLPVLGRTYGFASDYLRTAQIVTADGQLRTVSAQSDPDLFFAIRGGKASVGIVTSMTMELMPLSEIYGGSIFFDGQHAARLLDAYRTWAPSLPDATTTTFKLLRLPPLPGVPEPLREKLTVQLVVAHAGSEAEGAGLVEPMRAVAPGIIDDIRQRPYREADQLHLDPQDPLPVSETSAQLHDLTPEAADALMAVAGPGVQSPLMMVELRQLGGMLARRPAVPDAVGARGAGYCLFLLGVLMPPFAGLVPGELAAATAAMAPFANGHTFVNLHGTPGSAADRARPWPPETYQRLLRVREAYDPSGIFQFGHSLTGPEQALRE